MKPQKKRYRKERKTLTPQQEDVFRQAFQIFDTNHSKTIDEFQLSDLMKALGFNYDPQKIQQIMKQVDKDNSGVIQIDQFIEFMRRHILDSNNIRRQIQKVFSYFDDDNTGYIDFRKLKVVANECCNNLDDETLKKMIEVADTDGDTKVSKYQFMRVMKKMKLI